MHSSYGEGLETDRARCRYRASPLPDNRPVAELIADSWSRNSLTTGSIRSVASGGVATFTVHAVSASDQIERIACMFVLAGSDMRLLFCEVGQIAGCCSRGSAGDGVLGLGQVRDSADGNARTNQKLLFGMDSRERSHRTVRPIGFFPIPGHERYAGFLSINYGRSFVSCRLWIRGFLAA